MIRPCRRTDLFSFSIQSFWCSLKPGCVLAFCYHKKKVVMINWEGSDKGFCCCCCLSFILSRFSTFYIFGLDIASWLQTEVKNPLNKHTHNPNHSHQSSNPNVKVVAHTGHRFLFLSHGSIHSTWKMWKHGVDLTTCPATRASRHITHCDLDDHNSASSRGVELSGTGASAPSGVGQPLRAVFL